MGADLPSRSGDMDIRIQALGGLSVLQDGRELAPLVRQPTRAALLVFLAVERDVTRDVVLGTLWSRLAPDRARHALNQALYLLRKQLGDDWLVAEGDRLRVTEALTADAIDFEEQVRAGSFEEALPLYAGPFLEGWYLRDTPEFEHWTDRIRLRLSRLHGDARRARLTELRREGRTPEALELAREWVRSAPLQDEAHHALIELLALSGRRAEALEHYEAYAKDLERQDLSPLDETRALVERIRAGEEGAALEEVERLEEDGAESPDDAAHEPDGRKGLASTSPSRRRLLRRLAAAAALLAAALLVFTALGDRSAAPALDPDRVLVYPLENRTGDATLDPTGRLAADWITRGLARADFLEAIPSTELLLAPETRAGDEAANSDYLERAKTTAREAGCGTLVTGAYYDRASEIEFHVQILEAPDWGILESVGPIRADATDPIEAVDVLGQRVLISMGLHRDRSLAGVFAKSERPPTYAAYVAFVDAFEKYLAGQWRESAADAMRANEISPEFTSPLIIAAVAVVNGWGDFRAADSVLRIAEASRDRLPYYDRLRLELVRATLWGDHRKAHRAAKEAAAMVPGGTANYALAYLGVAINRPRETLETIATFDPSRRGPRDLVQFWDTDTQARHMLGEHRRELRDAREGRSHFPDDIRPLWYEIRALAALGRIEELNRLLDESLHLRWVPGLNAGLILVQAVEELQVHGFPEEADEVLSRFPRWYDSLDPEHRMRPHVRVQLGRAHYQAGRLDAARAVFSEIRSAAPEDPIPLRYLGTIAARAGDRETALARSRELADLDGDYLFGQQTLGRAAIAARLGENQEALALLRRSVSEGVMFGTRLHADPDLRVLRDYGPYEEFMRPEG
jgi:DNA-binding SARP family transcriptional activator